MAKEIIEVEIVKNEYSKAEHIIDNEYNGEFKKLNRGFVIALIIGIILSVLICL